ncbi:MAG: L-lysine 6-transaminase [Acidobacteria bacterium]|nr:L-lysine 6-transaminase [Acidobacteriota bacterium]
MAPDDVMPTLKRRIQVDGFDIVLDLERSHGCWICDARGGREYLDCFTFFGSNPLGMNHPALTEASFLERLGRVAVNKPSNSDIYTNVYAEFVRTVDRVARPAGMRWFFFVEGGALAVENALKVAFDWKVRRNARRGAGERGGQVLHLERAFHGRSGYALSLTNTDPRKTMYYPKFDWPRIPSPAIRFPLDEAEARRLDEAEGEALARARRFFEQRGGEIAAVIFEPIQAEGGDRHFRPGFLQALSRLAHEHDALVVADEVQTGVGLTGRFWAHEHFGFEPDVLAFAKKMQVGGLMAGGRVEEEPENVFRVSSRINSTWGGHIVDMLRATRILEVIEGERLVDNAARRGDQLLSGLERIAAGSEGTVSNARGRGLMCAVSFPRAEVRDRAVRACFERGLMVLACGTRSLRFRPALTISAAEIDAALDRLEDAVRELARSAA